METISNKFTLEELATIIGHGQQLVSHGYFTGFNLIKSENPLPEESIIIHFLHDSDLHLEYIKRKLTMPFVILPRTAFYLFDPKYFDKPGFDIEYKDATFYDDRFIPSPLDAAKATKKSFIVSHDELDLLIPLHRDSLEAITSTLRQADAEGPRPFIDPFIIIKSLTELLDITGFVNHRPYVCIRRTNEEFYTILPDEMYAEELRKYLKKTCKDLHAGAFGEHSVAFEISQINWEALQYILNRIKPLMPLE